MADLLSHVLIAFIVFTVAGWAVDWLGRRWVAVGMVGAILPDLDLAEVLVDGSVVSRSIGLPFDWGAIHTLGGVLLLAAAGAVLFERAAQRRRAFLLLGAGGIVHLAVDGTKAWADGANGVSLYPFSWWRNPTPGLYAPGDRRVLVVAVVVAGAVWLLDRYLVQALRDRPTSDG
jgi:membrane-bound metal-dependent hydrolase YbcI (DUF457 family)